jgi:hypothetical protein
MAQKFRNRLLLAKIEGTPGVDAAPSPVTDAVLVESLRTSNQLQVERTEGHTGTLDRDPSITGGLLQQVSFTVKAKGSGTPEAPPEWGKLLKACGWAEVITAAAIGAAPQAATAGSATTVTGGANFTATAQLYRGMPLLLTGNPAAGAFPFVTDYTAAKLFSLSDTFSPVLDASTLLQIPKNVLYRPASASIPSLTLWVYKDGVLEKFVGCRGRFNGVLRSSGALSLSFTFWGLPGAARSDAAVPASPVFDQTRPPVWTNQNLTGQGAAKLNRLSVGIASLNFDSGNELSYPDNPGAAEGFDVAEIVARDITGRIDPMSTLVATSDRMAQLRAGTLMPLHARLGTAAGNRLGLVFPQIKALDLGDEDRRGCDVDAIPFEARLADAGLYIVQW